MTLKTVKKKLDELYGAKAAVIADQKNFDFFKPDLINYTAAQQEEAELYEKGLKKMMVEFDKKIVDLLKLAGL